VETHEGISETTTPRTDVSVHTNTTLR